MVNARILINVLHLKKFCIEKIVDIRDWWLVMQKAYKNKFLLKEAIRAFQDDNDVIIPQYTIPSIKIFKINGQNYIFFPLNSISWSTAQDIDKIFIASGLQARWTLAKLSRTHPLGAFLMLLVSVLQQAMQNNQGAVGCPVLYSKICNFQASKIPLLLIVQYRTKVKVFIALRMSSSNDFCAHFNEF